MRRTSRLPRSDVMQGAIEVRPRRSPAQRRSRDTVAVILEAAARVFAHHGYARGTTNRIAERAGVSVGSLYEYFPSKDAILVALAEAHLAEARSVLRGTTAELARTPTDVRGTVRAIVTATVRLHALAPALHRILFEQALRSTRIRAMTGEAEARSTAWWDRYLRAQREIAVPDPAVAAAVIFQTIDTMIHKVVIHADGAIPIERWIDEMVALVVGYLRAPR